MGDDVRKDAVTTPTPEEPTDLSPRRGSRGLIVVFCVLMVAVVGVGAWQLVDLHHRISTLESQNRRDEARLQRQQDQLGGLNAALLNTASGTSLGQIESKISTIESYTTSLAVRIGCVEQSVNTATVQPDGTLFVAIRC